MFINSRKSIIAAYERKKIADRQFALVSNNCWGADAYQDLGREYNTPFVGLFLYPDCYLNLLENLEVLLSIEPRQAMNSVYFDRTPPYPIGVLDNQVELHFLHYKSFAEAISKWTRRSERLLNSMSSNVPIHAKICDREGLSVSHLDRFHLLNYGEKISISVRAYPSKNHIVVPSSCIKDTNSVINGLKLYRRRYHYMDFASWIAHGTKEMTTVSKFFYYSRI